MAQFNDSTRRLIVFLLIIIVGSVLLVFDIPVLYLFFALVSTALVFSFFTGMLILSEMGADLRGWFSKPRATRKTQPSTKKDTKGEGKGIFGEFFSRDRKEKEESGEAALSPSGADDDLELEELDLYDSDDIASESGKPVTADAVPRDLLDHDAQKEKSAFSDDNASFSPFAIDTEEKDSEDIRSNMVDEISASDIAAYNASDDSLYDYGSDDEQEEQYEIDTFSGGVDDDDLFASLKSDIDFLKKKDDNVLLRDLKDFKFTAQDLVDDLDDIVTMITKPQK